MKKTLCSLGLVLGFIWTANGHMSMSFPVPRSYGRVSQTDCTSAKRAQKYLTWEWNEPMVPARPCTCHGTFQDATIPAGNVIPADSTISVKIAGSAFHNGGQCSFWYSTDGVNFHKFRDFADCTTKAVNNQPIDIVVPKTLPAACTTSCIFAWTWVPVSSGACEIYMTCADIQVPGAVGGATPIQSFNFDTQINTAACVRVGANGVSPLFTPTNFNGISSTPTNGGPAPSGTPPPAVTARPTSATTMGTGSNSPVGALCMNPLTPTNWGSINATTGQCGQNVGSCDVGHCCSSAGFCGPDLRTYSAAGNPIYTNYDTTPNSDFATTTAAFNAYCNNAIADFRMVPCCAIISGVYDQTKIGCLQGFTNFGTPGTSSAASATILVSVGVALLSAMF